MKNLSCLSLAFVVALTSAFSPSNRHTTENSLRQGTPQIYLSTKTAAERSADESVTVEEDDKSDPMQLQKVLELDSGFSYVDFAKSNPFVSSFPSCARF